MTDFNCGKTLSTNSNSIRALHIGVAVDKNVVSLSGHVNSYAEKVAAIAAAQRVKGRLLLLVSGLITVLLIIVRDRAVQRSAAT